MVRRQTLRHASAGKENEESLDNCISEYIQITHRAFLINASGCDASSVEWETRELITALCPGRLDS